LGNSVDLKAATRYEPGDFLFIPGREPHFGQTQGATVVQITGNGPFQLNIGAPK